MTNCYCNEDQGAGYTYNDEHGPCDVCIDKRRIENVIFQEEQKEHKELQFLRELQNLCTKYNATINIASTGYVVAHLNGRTVTSMAVGSEYGIASIRTTPMLTTCRYSSIIENIKVDGQPKGESKEEKIPIR